MIESLPVEVTKKFDVTPLLEGLSGIYWSDAVSTQGGSDGIDIAVNLPVALAHLEKEFHQKLTELLGEQRSSCKISFNWQMLATQSAGREPIANVKNIIAVASGKGGVGKSTTAANIALALTHLGCSVGVVDADIYGPSQSLMLDVEGQQAELLAEKQIKPITTPYGIVMMGMGNLVMGDAPMAWRGPMATGALQQLLRNTVWPALDYLIVDMPPGTGDIQLTLAQTVPVSGSVIVTTPQDIALLDAKKGIELFRKVDIDVIGIVENMATHTCSHCGHEEAIFGDKGGQLLAEKYGTPLLGRLPLKLDIRQQADSGKPSVASDMHSAESQIYISIAEKIAVQLWACSRHEDGIVFSESED